jgi:hypothetical protein
MANRVDDVLNRMAGHHPGFTLVDFEEVGLPFFELRLDVMALRRHELPVIDEFVMHLAHTGLRSPDDVAGLLGLEEVLVQRSVASLLQSDYADYPVRGKGREVVLTPLGTQVLKERMDQVPVRAELQVGFDRLLWRMSTKWMRAYEPPQSFKKTSVRLIPPRAKRRLGLEDVDLPALNGLLNDLPYSRRSQIDYDVVQVLHVAAPSKILRALMLVFVADDHSAVRASFVIDGHHSPDHDRAFEDIDGLNRLRIEAADPASLDVDRPRLPDELRALERDESTALALRERRAAAQAALDAAMAEADLEDIAASVKLEGVGASQPDSSTRVDTLRENLAALEQEEDAWPLRPISTYEHRLLLADALANAHKRLLVISPWVRASVVDDEFLDRLGRLCSNGVIAHIGYGIRKNDVGGNDQPAVEGLLRLTRKHTNLTVRDMGGTHAKILVWDGRMVLTSFNWLSFRGDPNRRYRQEAGVLIGERAYVDSQYERHRAEIEGSRPRGPA